MNYAARSLTLAALLCACGPRGGQMPAPARRATYALKGVRVLDVVAARYSPRSVVLVSGDRIAQVIPADAYRPDLADSTIDLSDKVLVPGLIDAHVHLVLGGPPAANALATLRAGFTTVVDLGARSQRVLRLRDSVNAGLIPGPRILAAGMWVGIQGGVCEFSGIGVAGGPDAFRRRIRENVAAGADLIKLCVSGWPAEAFAKPERYEMGDDILSASVAEAHQARRLAVAHDLSRGGVAAALRAGIDGLAHAAYVDSTLATEMRRRNVFLIPTLASLAGGDSSAAARALVAAVALAHRLQVPIVFGTDGGVLPHGSNAREFAALREAGLRPIDALRAATINAASALGLADSLGAVRAGMLADLVAIDGDVLADLETLKQPRFVMARGRVVLR